MFLWRVLGRRALMKASDMIARLAELDGDPELFRSHGHFSREVIDAEVTDMCQSSDGTWRRCQVDSCTCPKKLGVLIL